MLKIAITGDIATGKSFVLYLFQKEQFPVYNADIEVNKIYQNDIQTIKKISQIIPQCINNDIIDKQKLARVIEQKPHLLNEIEQIVHQKLAENKKNFLQKNYRANSAVFEIPLLLETKQQNKYDIIIVTNVDSETKYQRFCKRKFSNDKKWNAIIQRQISCVSKIVEADYIIDTSNGKDITCLQVTEIIYNIKNRLLNIKKPKAKI